ncbi:MAG: hypothetical protein CMP16_02845 [Rickettsiales bacterium]|nr:hypothetical protein [Rickettsiales bacterium]|tara:strand:+ start:67 stop:1005 length:939 start_codon:yes stop_codon:yes gene_type:complete
MTILFYTTFSDEKYWKAKIKQYFKKVRVISINDKKYFNKVECAIVWDLPNNILKKLVNLKIIFSQGAGVDHILNLPSYKNTPILRLKDPIMGERMANHVLSQILIYQLKLLSYSKSQNKKIWLDNLEELTPLENKKITVGILGIGYLGKHVGNLLKSMNYKVIGYKKNKIHNNIGFEIFYKKNLNNFIKSCDILISILPSTKETTNFINKNFLIKMKKKSLLINVGRGNTINEKDLIEHLKKNKNVYASLDVFVKEPLSKKNKLWSMKNVTITPHIASITVVDSAVKQMFDRYKKYKKTGKIHSDVNINNGY